MNVSWQEAGVQQAIVNLSNLYQDQADPLGTFAREIIPAIAPR